MVGIPAPSLAAKHARDIAVMEREESADDEPVFESRHVFNSLPPLPPVAKEQSAPSSSSLTAATRYSSVSVRAQKANTMPPPSGERPRREPRLERVPKLLANLADVDVTSLDRREALLLARIDGMTNERELRDATAWREDEVAEVLARLVRMKLVSMR